MPSSRSAVQSQPNVTPMIDVMLVLLIIFMVAGPMLVAGDAVRPPDAAYLAAHPDQPRDYTLTIETDGAHLLNRRPIAASAVEPELRRLFSARPDDRVLYLRADRKVEYAVVQRAMDAAARGGASVVGLIAELPVAEVGATGPTPREFHR